MSMHEQEEQTDQVEAQLAQLDLHAHGNEDNDHDDDDDDDNEEEDEETRKKKYRWLDKYRTTPVLRRCFDLIFIHFSLLDWIRLESVCKWMGEEKMRIIELHRVAYPPTEADAEEQGRALAELEEEYRDKEEQAGDSLHEAIEGNDIQRAAKICLSWYGNAQIMNFQRG